ncbi:MAG TPA: YggT family protein [Ktedonobacterales bacterium]
MMHYTEPDDPRFANTDPAPRYVVETTPPPPQHLQPVERVERDEAYAPSWRGWRAAQIVYTIGGIIEVLIVIRALLELLAANPDAGFSSFIYGITDPLVAPFQGVFPTPHTNGSVLDMAAILAIIVYALVIWAIARLLDLAQRRSNRVV